MKDLTFFLPITKVDEEQRTVTGIATSSAVDSQGDIVDYQASKRAFSDWTGNIREMHEPKAIGKSIDVKFDDAKEQVVVTAKLSESADGENAWIKVKEGILKGFSIGGKIFDIARETVKSDDGENIVSRIKDYALAELSLVDVPANPEAQLLMVKSVDGGLQRVEEETATVQNRPIHDVWWLNKFMPSIEIAQKMYDESMGTNQIKKSMWDADWLLDLALSLSSYINMETYEGEDVSELQTALETIKQAVIKELSEPTEELTVAVELAEKVTNLKKGNDMSKDLEKGGAFVEGEEPRDHKAQTVTPVTNGTAKKAGTQAPAPIKKSSAVVGGEERDENAEVVTTAEENGRPVNDTEERAKENKTEVEPSAGATEEEVVQSKDDEAGATETTVIDGEVIDVKAEKVEEEETEATEDKKKADEPQDLVKAVESLVHKLNEDKSDDLKKVVDALEGYGAEIKKFNNGLKDLDSRISKLEQQPLPTKGQAQYVDVEKSESANVDVNKEELRKRAEFIALHPEQAKPGEAFELFKQLGE